MRTVKLFIVIFVVSLTCQIYAENLVSIKIVQNDSISKTIQVDENVTHLTFAAPEYKSITSIEGLEQLKNLESFDFYNLDIIDTEFFNSCPKLNQLWISGCTLKSLKFIEKLDNLTELYLDFDCDERIRKEKIDCKNLNRLKKIFFTGIVIKSGEPEKFGCVPRFIGIKSKCRLVLEDENITSLSEEEVKILKQFTSVALDANPILKNPDEVKLMQKANISFTGE